MKYIDIYPAGNRAIVDDEDYEWINDLKTWSLTPKGYALLSVYDKERKNTKQLITMHRLIMFAKKGDEIDHINGDKLDNRKGNLRFVTRSQNLMNRKKFAGSSIYKGVSYHKGNKKWQVWISAGGKAKFLGHFDNERYAAYAYDIAAKDVFGEYARLNFPEAIHG